MKYAVRERKSDILSDLLFYRGIDTPEKRTQFFAPDYINHFHDPFLMRHMDLAVDRLYRAVKNNERVAIFSDYDADGIPGAVVLHDLLKKIGFSNFENYIPHRHDEGFGLNKKAIEGIRERGANLMITIDCGISDNEKIAYANELGIDVIITDHHLPHNELPKAYAILNPKVADCAYPEKMLCGSGVIFKFVQAFIKKYGTEFNIKEGWEKWLLDMVGIATLSDMVPLTGENRAMAHFGLKVLKKTPRPGLSKLFQKLKIKRDDLTEDDIGFSITPRINAASRMGEPEQAFRLLATDDEVLADVYANDLEHVNNERKGTVASMVKEVKKIISERDISDKPVIVLGNPLWRPSLLGLVANSLAEEHSKPVFLWGRDGDRIIKGSARSGRASSKNSNSVFSLMNKAVESRDLFIEFGGHGASGGFAVKEDAVHFLEESLNNAHKELSGLDLISSENDIGGGLVADFEISAEEVTWNMYKEIEKLAPFGIGNPKPIFVIKNAVIKEVKSFGKEGNHTEIILIDKNNRKLSAIKFFLSKNTLPLGFLPGSVANLVVHLEKSTFKRYPELRLRIIDIL